MFCIYHNDISLNKSHKANTIISVIISLCTFSKDAKFIVFFNFPVTVNSNFLYTLITCSKPPVNNIFSARYHFKVICFSLVGISFIN